MDLYDQVIEAFREVVGTGRRGRHYGTSSSLTRGIEALRAVGLDTQERGKTGDQ